MIQFFYINIDDVGGFSFPVCRRQNNRILDFTSLTPIVWADVRPSYNMIRRTAINQEFASTTNDNLPFWWLFRFAEFQEQFESLLDTVYLISFKVRWVMTRLYSLLPRVWLERSSIDMPFAGS